MHKDSLLEVLNSNSMRFKLSEIEEMLDDELNKPPEEMDTELVDICTEVLQKIYIENDKRKAEYAKRKLKVIRIKKIIAIAAVIAIFFTIAIPISAEYLHLDVSDSIINFYNNHFNLDLRNGKSDADEYSDNSIEIIKRLNKLGINNVILPPALLTDDYEHSISYTDENDSFLTIEANITSKKTDISGFTSITKYKTSDTDFIKGFSEISNMYDSVKQITINGMDVIVFSDQKTSYIRYIDNDITYSISLDKCDFDSAVNIAESMK